MGEPNRYCALELVSNWVTSTSVRDIPTLTTSIPMLLCPRTRPWRHSWRTVKTEQMGHTKWPIYDSWPIPV